MIYLPKDVHSIVERAFEYSDYKDFAGILEGISKRRNVAVVNWLSQKDNALILVDIYYHKKPFTAIPDMVPFEEAVKNLMDGKIISVINPKSYNEHFQFCYYKGKFYAYHEEGNIWKINPRFFDWYNSAFVLLDKEVDLQKMTLAGVNSK